MILSPLQVYAKSSKDTLDSLQVLQFQVEGVVFEMRRIEGGLFVMGGTAEQHQEVISTDLPTHTVSLDAYYIASTEVTVALWKVLMPEWYIPDDWNTANHPITNITWYDCQEFIRRLDSITGLPFRLPTEAEWEFAARGGNASKGYRFAGSNKIEDVGWGFYNAGFKIHRVGCKQPNELGLYDMTGNVSEWCSDWYGRYYLGTEPNPQGADKGEWKVIRGGSFDNCKDIVTSLEGSFLNLIYLRIIVVFV
jgi:formylglycine-generating enzyme required for sulfatase activity